MMERLTVKWTDKVYDTLEPVGIVDNEYSKINYEKIITKLGEYEDLVEQGLLLRLPCKVGDTAWFVGEKYVNDYEVRRFIIDETGIAAIQIAKTIDGIDYWNSFSIDDLGKTVFLTKAEAEQKLKEMESDLL